MEFIPQRGGPALGGEPGGVGLDHATRLEQRRQFAYLDGGDEHPPAWHHSNELVALEPLNRLTDRCAADAEALLEGDFIDHGLWGQFEGDDEPLYRDVRLIAQRLGPAHELRPGEDPGEDAGVEKCRPKRGSRPERARNNAAGGQDIDMSTMLLW